MAEREGFEPSEHLLSVHAISSRAPSAARAPLRKKSRDNKKKLSSYFVFINANCQP